MMCRGTSTFMNVARISLLILFSSVLFVAGQSPTSNLFVPPANPPRYLIVVEKDANTVGYDDAIRQAVFDLVYQGGGGEMADGSVIEIWIVGEDTARRGFVPEMLRPDNHLFVAQKASAYLKQFPSQGQPDMPEFAEHIRNLASVAFETTIFFVSSPQTRLNGTTVDNEVNEILAVHAGRMAEARKPFITTFRIQDGILADYSVSDSALVPAVPPMPPSRVSALEKERMIAEARAALKAVEDEKQKAAIEATRQAEVIVPEAKPPVDLRKIPDDEREGAIILRGKPRKPEEVVQSSTAPSVEDTKTSIDSTVPASVTTTTAAATVEKPVATTERVPVESEPVVTSATETVGLPAQTTGADVLDAGTGARTNANAGTAAVVPGGASIASTNVAVSDAPDDASPPATNFAVQPQTWLTAGGLLVAGLAFFIVAGVLVWIAIRRARVAAGPSFITRSMNDRKNLKG